ncbi:hydroxymethylglutaryl-CoA lyase [Ralstonia sp. A12]|uniref:hydroxymethylglutaryl-CoA lyase n=1 Tax=Ralstonia sp. A12 TaxID=1217052 RepID=UPI0009FCD068|nr:hydroxymethylglutaryl-CoA lyase [Ralstonia sp. A12]
MRQQSKNVIVQEVGLRDGLQSVPVVMPTHAKKAWVNAAYTAGVRHIEVASFVPAKLLPQMADAEQVVAHALTFPDLVVTALVPNLKGAENALKAGAHRIVAPISVSEKHSLANVRKTPDAMIAEFQRMRELRDSEPAWSHTALVAGLSTVFGCSYQGYVPEQDVCDVALKAIQAGADVVALGDTTGHATPTHVKRLLERLLPIADGKVKSLHFHDTRGLALANTVVALEHGVREFDASLAGLGGCPHAPGATGNVATEDLVYLLHSMGYETGIDLQGLIGIRAILTRELPSEPLYGHISRAGILDSSVPQQLSAHGVQ